jgi:hypothetical protein
MQPQALSGGINLLMEGIAGFSLRHQPVAQVANLRTKNFGGTGVSPVQ